MYLEKLHKPENQLYKIDFENEERLGQRELELKSFLTEASEMYTGSQHIALMDGIKGYRKTGGLIDLNILSAGYGLISENQTIAPYEVTFNTMDSTTIRNWSAKQKITETLKERIKGYDLVFFLLGDKYLQSIEWPLAINNNQKFVFFAGESSKSRVLIQDNYHLMAIGEAEAKRFRFGLIGIKGFLFSKLLSQVASQSYAWEEIIESPQLIRQKILKSFESNKQIELFSEDSTDSLLKFYLELFPVETISKNYSSEFRFFMPENDDRVDPNFDFFNDFSEKNRDPLINDRYAHELLHSPQYDGMLISKVNIDNATHKKRELIQEKGIREFLRLPKDYPIMGDCGAFSYITEEVPPYSTEDVINYYQELGFDYGVSVDHLIVGDFQKDQVERDRRYELTLANAKDFITKYNEMPREFTPVGVVQGWDPLSFKKAVQDVISNGYQHIALGGLAREQSEKIYEIMKEISPIIPNENFKIHLFGVARDMRTMKAFHKLGVTSFDSASPLRRAWLGSGHNYHTAGGRHYTAIRIPEAKETAGRVKKMILEGKGEFAQFKKLEQDALVALRGYVDQSVGLEDALTAILAYDDLLGENRSAHEEMYREVLANRPWENCDCSICKEIGLDVVIFRGNNRNRRRGFHNTFVYYNQFKKLRSEIFGNSN